jgi:hypothetical protein
MNHGYELWEGRDFPHSVSCQSIRFEELRNITISIRSRSVIKVIVTFQSTVSCRIILDVKPCWAQDQVSITLRQLLFCRCRRFSGERTYQSVWHIYNFTCRHCTYSVVKSPVPCGYTRFMHLLVTSWSTVSSLYRYQFKLSTAVLVLTHVAQAAMDA